MTVNFQDRIFYDVVGCRISLYYPCFDDFCDLLDDFTAVKKDVFYCLDLSISDGSSVFSGFLTSNYDLAFDAFRRLHLDILSGKPKGVIE